ncbi:gliding motility protein [Pedobacter polaris]|uniref:Gliding motility protein n=1 Tax=Pedobacter polaris TaxID=2571273 RepID=A0A4U1CTT8_9SPHI|nr:tetratricopeptide repeat protein [Pedobacter polaris]TKC12203.1 gliding motility protein [Pedobacter polaris]
MNNYTKLSIKILISCLSIAIFSGCSTQKNNAKNRGLQNLSARYNYIYNSNVLLNTYQENLSQTHKDNYDNFLAVYIAPEQIDYSSTAPPQNSDKALDEITQKAQTIVAEKALSNYIDEAYILLGKTNFYKGNYFTATEYFDYTARTYKNNNKVYLNALTWKARSLMRLNNYDLAIKVLDTVYTTLDSVKSEKAEPLATLAQMSIDQLDYKKAITYLEAAIKESNQIQSRTRWPYILAQLYEHEKEYDASLKSYTKVENSNAPFEMYFNAKLSKIRINDLLNDQSSNRKQALLKLLKDDKNFDYTDQIYYEVAEDYYGDADYAKAEEYYKLSTSKSTINQYQKGLTYLKLADLNFKNLGNYVNAKLYYDSAANTLPKTYLGYDAILKKSQNLEYLTQRYQTIAKQDSLQMIAKLPEQAREKMLDEIFEPKKNSITNVKTVGNEKSSKINDPFKSRNNGAFYFSNTSAISTGFTDFKKKWGNRPLEDNWRQSLKSSAQVNQQNQASVIGTESSNDIKSTTVLDKTEKIKAYSLLLPLTAEQRSKSDQQIIEAYFEIASFYQQVLEDQEEATKVYEILLARYPQNNHLDAIYYSLYLGNTKRDLSKSESYKNMVLAKFPNSVYAKTILDPNFSAKQNALDVEVNNAYNAVFDKYEKKDFSSVIIGANEINQRFPGNSLQAQYDYLKAIAIGRTQNVDSLLTVFNKIITQHPNDQLINPLVKDHLAYINANLASFKARKIALIDFDATEPRFIAQQENSITVIKQEPLKIIDPVIPGPKKVIPDANVPIVNPPTPTQITAPNQPIVSPAVEILFSKAESNTYYYVIAVGDVTVSVSSSRFGVGQFNRGNFPGTGLKHQLEELDDDQLIYVGNFENLTDVRNYFEGITPQLPRIMKVPATKYTGFFITKDNFAKIKNRETLNRYIEFFKSNY